MRILPLLSGALALGVATASATAEPDRGSPQQATFMIACEEGATARTCRCVLQRVEERVSPVAFAEEIDRHGTRIMTADSLAPAIDSARRTCEALAMD